MMKGGLGDVRALQALGPAVPLAAVEVLLQQLPPAVVQQQLYLPDDKVRTAA